VAEIRAAANAVTIEGTIAALDALRRTPAGIAIVNATLAHASKQIEAGGERDVSFEVACVAVEMEAQLLAAAPLGSRVRAHGFMAAKGKSSRSLVLHISRIEFLGADDGIR
jgi:primosomal replication protein N